MLRWGLMRFQFFRFSQSGMYVDFIMKQFIEYTVRNLFVYTALFFGEKYIIEYWTKKTVDSFVFNSNKISGVNDLNVKTFFNSLVGVIFYTIICLGVCYYVWIV